MSTRATIVLDSDLEKRLRGFKKQRKLSPFINQCIREHFQKSEQQEYMRQLELAYDRAAKAHHNFSDEYSNIEVEGWPEW